MKKFHRIGDSKESTTKRIQRMLENLGQKYPQSYVAINAENLKYRSGKITERYWFNIEGIWSDWLPSWPELLKKYRELMKA